MLKTLSVFRKEGVHTSKERERAILELLIRDKQVSVKKLAAALYISEPSIRRDLARLEQQQLIKRVHGGAVLDETGVSRIKIPFVIRELEAADEKSRIARQAADLVPDGAVLFLDASSSAYRMVPFLAEKSDLTVITSGLRATTALAEQGIRVISTGGDVMNTCLSLVGDGALETIRNYHADFCFFSCRGLAASGELSDISREENLVRREMLRHTDAAYLLCTGNKLEKQYYHRLCHAAELSGIITASPLPTALLPYRLQEVEPICNINGENHNGKQKRNSL